MRDRRASPRLPSVPSYPEAPPGWTAVRRRKVGPFTIHVTYRRADGGTTEWHSRAHRKRASLLSRSGRSGWWAPAQASFWIGVLFAVGSACFVVAPFPGFVSLVGAAADAAVFFAGSLFFTAAAALQYLDTPKGDRIDRRASAIQLAGTLLFNLSTGRALHASVD